MTSFSGSPKLTKGGLVLVDPETAAVQTGVSFHYNPESLNRTFRIQAVGTEGTDRSQALRIKGPAVEVFKLDVIINAIDQLEFPDQNPNAVQFGIQPQLALLELLIHPHSSKLAANNALARSGVLEIIPMESALPLFVWGKNRIVPVRVTEMTITEESFDPTLNPVEAKVALSLRVLSVDDLGFSHKGGGLFMTYLQAKENLAARAGSASLSTFGISGVQ